MSSHGALCSRARGCSCNQKPINQTEEMEPAEKRRQSILSYFTWTNTRYCYMLFILLGGFEVIHQPGNGR